MLDKDPSSRARASQLLKHKLFQFEIGELQTVDSESKVNAINPIKKGGQLKSLSSLKSGGQSPA